ncbi:MAG: carboxymuconolactone decarboxylase family protein [Pseudomonadota bacterium]
MPKINPINLSDPGAARDVVDSVKKSLGSVPNIFATLAHSPAALEGFLGFSGALSKGVLPASVREQIALTVAGANECDYCASAHTLMAKGAGVAEEEARQNLRGQATDPKVAAILTFARNVVETRGRVSDQQLAELRSANVSDAELVEVIAHIGVNLFTNYFNHIADTQVDFPFVTSNTRAA